MTEEPLPAAPPEDSLKGRLIIAAHALVDSNFERTVVLMIEHSEEGAFGIVVNRPSELEIAEILPEWAHLATDPEVVFFGGPVEADDMMLGLGRAPLEGTAVGPPGVVVVNLDEDPPPGAAGTVRFYAGYAGWDAGQLEDELAAGAWYVGQGDADTLFSPAPERLWLDLLRNRGGLFTTVPEDPNLN